tara:strand:- start:809 stop:1021 length:213 start_codon:yes stop_codon:yes gene_type:complete
MMLLIGYTSKKELIASKGKALDYQETSFFGEEYKRDGTFCGAHRPAITGLAGKEFFAEITMKKGVIEKVA